MSRSIRHPMTGVDKMRKGSFPPAGAKVVVVIHFGLLINW